MNWNRTHEEFPQRVEKIKVKAKLPGEKKQIYVVTPDGEIQEPEEVYYKVKLGDDQRQEIIFELDKLLVFSVYICVWNRILSVGKKTGGFLHEIEIR